MPLDLPRRDFEPDARAPLDGVRVLDLSRLVAGNVLTHLLADYGADVVKVERPGHGDDLRSWRVNGVSAYFKVYCRNKRSITLNLREPAGRDLLLDLVEHAHVLVENFKPGTLERWGLGPDSLLGRNPALVVTRISGWGQDGSESHKPGFGSLVEARAGFAAKSGFADRPPVLPPLALADHVAGMTGAFAVMVALREAERGGAGQVVDVPLFDPMVGNIGPDAALLQITGEVPQRTGSRSTITAPRNVYRCQDGKYVALSASMQSMAERLFRAIGRPELLEDPRYRTNADRVRNNDTLDPVVAGFMASRPRAEILEFFEAADVTVGPVSDVEDLVADPLVRERAVLAEYPDAEMGTLAMHAPGARLSATPARMRRPAPALGEHNAEVYAEIGVDAERLAAYVHGGIA